MSIDQWNTECGDGGGPETWPRGGSAVVHPNCPPVVGRIAATQAIWSHQSVAGNFARPANHSPLHSLWAVCVKSAGLR